MQAFVKECTWMILKWYKIIRFLFYHNVFLEMQQFVDLESSYCVS